MKRINSALITGVVTGICTGVLLAYISWEATGRQGKLTQYISSSLLFSSLITISSMVGVSLGFTQDLKRKLSAHTQLHSAVGRVKSQESGVNSPKPSPEG